MAAGIEEIRGGAAALLTLLRAAAEQEPQGRQSVSIVHFWAPWCEPCTHMDEVLAAAVTSASTPAVALSALRCEAEEEGELSEQYEIEAVPTFVALRLRHRSSGELEELGRVEGASPAELGQLAAAIAARQEYKAAPAAAPGAAEEDITARLTKLVKKEHVMLFMKGKPSAPRCGFSKRVANALLDCYGGDAEGTEVDSVFGNFDILGDEEVRQGLKTFSKWPTFPQLYIDGELVGGCDIIMEMHEAGELKEMVLGG